VAWPPHLASADVAWIEGIRPSFLKPLVALVRKKDPAGAGSKSGKKFREVPGFFGIEKLFPETLSIRQSSAADDVAGKL